MSLLPFFMDLQPRRRRFSDLLEWSSPDDLVTDVFEAPYERRLVRPIRRLALATRDLGSKIKVDKDKFQVNVDVQHFSPEEISVKTVDGHIIIEGKHEEKKDDHGFVSRQFTRRYALPEGCSPGSVESKLSSDGILSITAPRQLATEEVRAIPITHTGPMRRKLADDEDEPALANGDQEMHEEAKTPQKKKSKR